MVLSPPQHPHVALEWVICGVALGDWRAPSPVLHHPIPISASFPCFREPSHPCEGSLSPSLSHPHLHPIHIPFLILIPIPILIPISSHPHPNLHPHPSPSHPLPISPPQGPWGILVRDVGRDQTCKHLDGWSRQDTLRAGRGSSTEPLLGRGTAGSEQGSSALPGEAA